jgi:hypothetical protein
MQIYKVSWIDPYQGMQLRWQSCMRDAKKVKTQITKEYVEQEKLAEAETPMIPEVTIDLVDFPKGKKGILAWLNAHFTSDNG